MPLIVRRRHRSRYIGVPLLLAVLGCSMATEVHRPARAPAEILAPRGGSAPTAGAPAPRPEVAETLWLEWAEELSYPAEGPASIDMAEVPLGVPDPTTVADRGEKASRIGSPLPDEVTDLLRRLALGQPPTAGVQASRRAAPGARAPTAGISFDGPDAGDCCGGGVVTPPDPEVAAGPNHLIAVVNVAFEIYDKSGNSLPAGSGGPAGPRTFASFFASASVDPPLGCSSPFDPNVLYDEQADRFIIGVDSGFTGYCVAASKTGDPTGEWWAYRFATNVGGAQFDFPHAGVGREAIVVGSNQFVGQFFLEGRVFAWKKAAMYAGGPLMIRSRSTGSNSTPQPVHLHGFAQGTWPGEGPEYVLTETFDGSNHSVWAWQFDTNEFVKLSPDLDLAAASGVPCPATSGFCFPIDAPQLGSTAKLQANDYRGLDAEYRNGSIWTTQSISCNPGGGVVDCVRWAEIDPTVPAVVQAGVFGSDGDYRLFPDSAANHCGDAAIGYTRTGPGEYPGAVVTGRRFGDPAGTLQAAEATLKEGEIAYTAFDTPAHRWGDYSGMTSDPDGFTFWYLGEYSKDILGSTKWGNYLGSFSYPCAILGAAPATVDFGLVEQGSSSAGVEIAIANTGNGAGSVSSMTLSDTANFSFDVGGGADPCNTSMPVIDASAGCTVEVSFQPTAAGPFAASLTLESSNPANTRVIALEGGGWIECTAPETVDLATPDPVMDYVACGEILAGPWVIDQPITLTAGDSIELRNGLTIAAGVNVSMVNDPYLGPP